MSQQNPPLPREIIKWLQSLDLSFTVKNPRRDFSNGFVVAEVCSRYFTKDVDMHSFENGSRLEAKVNNWEQLFKLFQKKGLNITKEEFEPVIHCAAGAGTYFILKLHNLLTDRTVKVFAPKADEEAIPRNYMRDTAAKRLKDHEIDRIQDKMVRTYRAAETLIMYHEERRAQKAAEAPTLLFHERRSKMGAGPKDETTLNPEETVDSVQIDEVRVKALVAGETQVRGRPQRGNESQQPPGVRSQLLKAVSEPKASVGALAGMPPPAIFVKPATDIMRNLVTGILQESEELSKLIDSRKDVVVCFMEQCREGVPEDIAVRVFHTLANRAQLLVDTLTKSAPEFWKVWSTFYPALTDFSESSPIFDSAVFLFKRLGEEMREADPQLTQQLITQVGLQCLSKELGRSPEKREALCEILYSYTVEDTLNHLLVLRALKDKIGDLAVYVSCLACLISVDAHLGLLDEHLLDLYIYYALMAMQSAQPKTRVAGISILSTITMSSSQWRSVVALIPSFAAFVGDDWWEVQAQLLLLSASLLRKLTDDPQDAAGALSEDGSAWSPDGVEARIEDAGAAGAVEDPATSLLEVISQLFVVSNSKNMLQVGLSALVHLLSDFSILLPIFVSVLLGQPPALRARLLRQPDAGAGSRRLTYVMGNSSRMYEEKCIGDLWPHLDVAKTFAMQVEASRLDHFELEHMEVLLASLPATFDAGEADEWLAVFEKVKQNVFVALVDPSLHDQSTQIISLFWTCPVERIATRSMEASKKTLLQALRLLYGGAAPDRIEEGAVLKFLRDLRNRGGILQMEVVSVIESFRDAHPEQYEKSKLDSVLA